MATSYRSRDCGNLILAARESWRGTRGKYSDVIVSVAAQGNAFSNVYMGEMLVFERDVTDSVELQFRVRAESKVSPFVVGAAAHQSVMIAGRAQPIFDVQGACDGCCCGRSLGGVDGEKSALYGRAKSSGDGNPLVHRAIGSIHDDGL